MNWLKLILMCLFLFTSSSATLAEQAEAVLRAGVASMITPVSAVKYYQQVVEYIGKKLGIQAEMVHRTTYDEIDVMLENRELEVAFICSSPYVLDHEKFGVELLVVPQVNGEVFYHSEIIVHKDSEIETFDQLRNTTFAFVDPKSNSGKLYPTYLLARQNQTPESFFASQLYSYSHNKSVELVAKRRADGAAVDSIVYAFMKATGSPYAEETKIIHRSPPFGIPPVVVPLQLPLHLRASLKSVFLNMHNDPEGHGILTQMRIERFVEASDSDYDSIRAMRAFIDNSGLNLLSTRQQQSSKHPEQERVVQFGVLPRDNPILAYERYQPLMDYLSETTGIKTELHLEKNYQAVVNSLGQGKIAFALLGPLTYLDAYKRYAAVPIARSKTSQGKATFRSVIVTSRESDLAQLGQLVGKRFAFGEIWSTSGNLIPRYMLAWGGIHLDHLGSYLHYNYQDTVAKKVISGEVDAGALREATAERYGEYGLKIIATSDPIPTGPVVASSRTAYPLIQAFQKALLDLATSDNGSAILKKLDPEIQGGFIPASDADYFEIRNMINDVPMTCGKDCHPKISF